MMMMTLLSAKYCSSFSRSNITPRNFRQVTLRQSSSSSTDEGYCWQKLNYKLFSSIQRPGDQPIKYKKSDFDVKSIPDLLQVSSPTQPSPVHKVQIKGKSVYIKRDDLIRLEGSGISGNKARKFYALNQIPAEIFPNTLVSYGGPQGNAMVALAAIVASKNRQITEGETKKRFVYYTKQLPKFLRQNPVGNFYRAKSLDTDFMPISNDQYRQCFGGDSGGSTDAPAGLDPPGPDSAWIPQGGASGVALEGAKLLALEVVLFWQLHGNGRPLSVFVPGGTCTTAYLLHQELQILLKEDCFSKLEIRVVVIPCCGDQGYAARQMMSMADKTRTTTTVPSTTADIPKVLPPSPDFYLQENKSSKGYFRFAAPHPEILKTYREMLDDYGVSVDLLYGAPSWSILLRHWDDLEDSEIMYIHSGGLEGINSQMMRYRHKGMIKGKDVQHPKRKKDTKELMEASAIED